MAYEPWIDRPLTVEELEAYRAQLAKMPRAELVKSYEAGLHMCQLTHGEPPRACFVQRLVQTWRELERRRKNGPR